MQVELRDSMGTDLSVVNAARVSMQNESDWERIPGQQMQLNARDKALIRYLAEGLESKDKKALFDRIVAATTHEEAADIFLAIRLINRHWAPFSHCSASFRITAPLAVFRQLWKSHVGLTGGDAGYPGWSEVSRRYVSSEPEFFTPDVWRERGINVKQGSGDGVVDIGNLSYRALMADANRWYMEALERGVAPEQARLALPQSMVTQVVWTGSLAAWARVCQLRLDAHAQRETQQIACMISDHCKALWPESWSALLGV